MVLVTHIQHFSKWAGQGTNPQKMLTEDLDTRQNTTKSHIQRVTPSEPSKKNPAMKHPPIKNPVSLFLAYSSQTFFDQRTPLRVIGTSGHLSTDRNKDPGMDTQLMQPKEWRSNFSSFGQNVGKIATNLSDFGFRKDNVLM